MQIFGIPLNLIAIALGALCIAVFGLQYIPFGKLANALLAPLRNRKEAATVTAAADEIQKLIEVAAFMKRIGNQAGVDAALAELERRFKCETKAP